MLIWTCLHIQVSVCIIRLTFPASLNSVYLFHIRSLSIALWRKRCDKDGEVGGAVCLYNLTRYPCSLCMVWLYVWGPMCSNSSLSSLEVGMAGGMKMESRLRSFLIRYLTNHLFLAMTYCLSSDMQGLQYQDSAVFVSLMLLETRGLLPNQHGCAIF